MAVYAIGDVQGCHEQLLELLDRINFDPAADRLWFVGDLVNRGPRSLAALRFVRGLGERAVTVLGNHDLHLLAIAAGVRRPQASDSLDDVLQAEDRDELLDWLRHRPVLHHDAGLGYTLVHAGLAPQWDLDRAQACAAEVEAVLRSPECTGLLRNMYGSAPDLWSEGLSGWDRLRFILNCCTRLRFCDAEGRLHLREKGGPQDAHHLLPWFAVPGRATAGSNIVFGHWSALGRYQAPGIYAIDSGCVWGRALTALRLDSERPQWFEVNCPAVRRPAED